MKSSHHPEILAEHDDDVVGDGLAGFFPSLVAEHQTQVLLDDVSFEILMSTSLKLKCESFEFFQSCLRLESFESSVHSLNSALKICESCIEILIY